MITQEEYSQLKAGYVLDWTDEQLEARKQLLQTAITNAIEEHGPEVERTSAHLLLKSQYHDVNDEQGARAYYAANPSPTRAEFNAQHP